MISATPSHPFYVAKFGWTLATDLRAGDVLVLSNGEYVTVEFVQHEILENPVKVYNFEVEDYHTYFVGDSSVLVHNDCTSKLTEAFDAADNYNLDENVYNNHIVDRHGPNSSYGSKSKFDKNFDIKQGIDDALRNPNAIIKPNSGGRNGYIFEYTYANAIGAKSNGKPLSTIKVVIDEIGNVITAFPKK